MKIVKPEKTQFKGIYALRIELPNDIPNNEKNIRPILVPSMGDKKYVDIFIENLDFQTKQEEGGEA